MQQLLKLVGILAGVIAVVRIAQSPKVCVCAGPLCACGYPRR